MFNILIVALGVTIPLISHLYIKNYWGSSWVSSFIMAFSYQVLNFVMLGHLDPFFFVSFFTVGFYSFLISLAIGIPFWIRRRTRKDQ
jgi:hypothetical protein